MDQIPIAQSEAMYSALFRQGKDAEFVTYWGALHSVTSPGDVRNVYARIFQFLDEHLGRSPNSALAGRQGVGYPRLPMPDPRLHGNRADQVVCGVLNDEMMGIERLAPAPRGQGHRRHRERHPTDRSKDVEAAGHQLGEIDAQVAFGSAVQHALGNAFSEDGALEGAVIASAGELPALGYRGKSP